MASRIAASPRQNWSRADGRMGRASQVIVLAEDQPHQRFVHRYLEQLGYSRHDIRFEDLPAGRGCGEQWVRERYARAVLAYRWRSARARTALVVVIDADKYDVERRLRQLGEALEAVETEARGNAERIAHFIPKRRRPRSRTSAVAPTPPRRPKRPDTLPPIYRPRSSSPRGSLSDYRGRCAGSEGSLRSVSELTPPEFRR